MPTNPVDPTAILARAEQWREYACATFTPTLHGSRHCAHCGHEEAAHVMLELVACVTALHAQLAECYRLTGADPDGNEDWRLAPYAVAEVQRLRIEYDEAGAQADAAEAKVAALQAERDAFHMDYRMKCDVQTKEQAVRLDAAEAKVTVLEAELVLEREKHDEAAYQDLWETWEATVEKVVDLEAQLDAERTMSLMDPTEQRAERFAMEAQDLTIRLMTAEARLTALRALVEKWRKESLIKPGAEFLAYQHLASELDASLATPREDQP